MLHFTEDLHWSESGENLPLRFHELSINSIQFTKKEIVVCVTIEFASSRIQQDRLPSFPKQNTEADKT